MTIQVLAGYWDFNLESQDLILCPRSRRMFGIDEAFPEILGQPDWQPMIHPDDLPLIARELKSAVASKEIYSARFRIVSADGSVRPILGIGCDPGGDSRRFVGLNFDLAPATAVAKRTAQWVGPPMSFCATAHAAWLGPANENELRPRRAPSRAAKPQVADLRSKGGRRELLLARARTTIKLRELRKRFFNSAMFGEPAFDVLLALYVIRDSSPALPMAAMATLAGLPQSNIARWLRLLVDEGLAMTLEADAGDVAEIRAAITGKGSLALDSYLAAFDLE